ncbi:MAG: hypothetical protein SFU99_22435 [Saprospiraceae bacterium]|nr:hypothetical protein [Saprospiraceae bacterium]
MKMKGLLIAMALLLGTFAMQAQADEWKEMDEYHSVMSATFHPAEEGDLKPVMTRAGELAQKAQAWKKSTAPAKFDTPEIKKSLTLLTKESKALGKMVKKGKSEEEVKKAIFALHDRFHEIMELCHH